MKERTEFKLNDWLKVVVFGDELLVIDESGCVLVKKQDMGDFIYLCKCAQDYLESV